MSQTIDKKLWKKICLKITGKDYIDETDERYDFVEAHYKTETESWIDKSLTFEQNMAFINYKIEDLRKQEEHEYINKIFEKNKNFKRKN
jgi:hypothetical protein